MNWIRTLPWNSIPWGMEKPRITVLRSGGLSGKGSESRILEKQEDLSEQRRRGKQTVGRSCLLSVFGKCSLFLLTNLYCQKTLHSYTEENRR